MSNKTIGGQAKELVLLFYEKNELKFTNKDIMVSIKNAKRLQIMYLTHNSAPSSPEIFPKANLTNT